MKSVFLPFLFAIASLNAYSQRVYLSGTDKDHTVPWDFYCTGGRNSGKWTKIPVPSNWELQGFGSYNYGHDKVKSNEQGLYKYEFASGDWKGKRVYIVFEGSMTDTKVSINGSAAGPVHQGSFYRFKYDITGLLLAKGRNLLEVTVSKTSANASVNNAERGNSDFWVFGGIFRPVYLEIVPETFIDRVAVNATADGDFHLDVYPIGLKGDETIAAEVQTLAGERVGAPFSTTDKSDAVAAVTESSGIAAPLHLSAHFSNPRLWSAEFPDLYKVIVTIRNKKGLIHRVIQKFGFRTVELRTGDGFYVNGARVMLKGVCRHSFWPETGRTLSYAIHLQDVGLIKEMNMNAVRMSHYPPDQEFLDVCDSLGLYVLDELTGWQAKYDTTVGHLLVKEMVVRDVNHPSIIFWDNGNEGGFNRGLDGDYALYDPQKRVVLHPWEKFNGSDTHHYPDYKAVVKAADSGREVYFPTEFLHGLYDGGAGAGLDDFWKVMMRHPHGAGGFIWALLDEDVVRTDKGGALDGDGNHAPDGILGPHREKEGSFYTIKEIWSPVYIDPQAGELDSSFTGKVPVWNRYAFTNLNQCTFKWQLVRFPSARDKSTKAMLLASGMVMAPDLAPGQQGQLLLSLPPSWSKAEALYLTAYGPDKKELFTWSWAIRSPAFWQAPAVVAGKTDIKTEETDSLLMLTCDGLRYYFNKKTGYIVKVVKPSGTVSLSHGPVLAGIQTECKQFTWSNSNRQVAVKADYEGAGGSLHVTWTFSPGQRVKLEYRYNQEGETDFRGITFDYPEEKITGVKWLGRGPYRVWKNRLRGQSFGVWQKDYNNTITGETWLYPGFKGYHADVSWVVIENKESPFTVYTSDRNIYLQLLHPGREKDALSNNNVEPPFPEGSIGFLQAIPPIGTKFHAASVMGPQGQKNPAIAGPVSGTLWFDFIH
ncbi:MAG TPA: glycoside hydrolase family 2 TIM barrel-domain containing protein [Puia sp.]|jgi:hypothetical protein